MATSLLCKQELVKSLIAAGLYAREADAMVATWQDSWFEEGTRLFYIVPGRAVDSILPLEIRPKPARIARAFVARMEIVSPATAETVARALKTSDQTRLDTYRRFLGPIVKQLLATSTRAEDIVLYKEFIAKNIDYPAANLRSTSRCAK